MAKIPKRMQKLPPHIQKGESHEDKKAGVESTIESHDFRFRDEGAIHGLGLDKKTRKQMSRAKKLSRKKV
jgi:hypothetical protein